MSPADSPARFEGQKSLSPPAQESVNTSYHEKKEKKKKIYIYMLTQTVPQISHRIWRALWLL